MCSTVHFLNCVFCKKVKKKSFYLKSWLGNSKQGWVLNNDVEVIYLKPWIIFKLVFYMDISMNYFDL